MNIDRLPEIFDCQAICDFYNDICDHYNVLTNTSFLREFNEFLNRLSDENGAYSPTNNENFCTFIKYIFHYLTPNRLPQMEMSWDINENNNNDSIYSIQVDEIYTLTIKYLMSSLASFLGITKFHPTSVKRSLPQETKTFTVHFSVSATKSKFIIYTSKVQQPIDDCIRIIENIIENPIKTKSKKRKRDQIDQVDFKSNFVTLGNTENDPINLLNILDEKEYKGEIGSMKGKSIPYFLLFHPPNGDKFVDSWIEEANKNIKLKNTNTGKLVQYLLDMNTNNEWLPIEDMEIVCKSVGFKNIDNKNIRVNNSQFKLVKFPHPYFNNFPVRNEKPIHFRLSSMQKKLKVSAKHNMYYRSALSTVFPVLEISKSKLYARLHPIWSHWIKFQQTKGNQVLSTKI